MSEIDILDTDGFSIQIVHSGGNVKLVMSDRGRRCVERVLTENQAYLGLQEWTNALIEMRGHAWRNKPQCKCSGS